MNHVVCDGRSLGRDRGARVLNQGLTGIFRNALNLPRILALSFSILGGAYGDLFQPTSNADSGPDTLRAAILAANATPGADVIDLRYVGGDIVLSSGLPLIDSDLQIYGDRFTPKVIDGNGDSIFVASFSAKLEISSIEFRNGFKSSGSGGAFSGGEEVTFTECIFRNCRAQSGGAVAASASFLACAFIGNSAEVMGGAIALSGGEAIFTNCLFQDNHAPRGGAIGATGSASITMIHCTVVENSATDGQGGGLRAEGEAELTLLNSIVANNLSTSGESSDLSVSGNSSMEEAGPNLIGGDPRLRPLSSRGGIFDRLSRVPRHDSPVVDAGTDAPGSGLELPLLDSENNRLPRTFGTRPDLGAVELRLARVTVTEGNGVGTLTDFLNQHRDPDDGRFDEIRLPAQVLLLESQLPSIADSLVVSGENGATIDGQSVHPGFDLGFSRPPSVHAYPVEMTFENLTFRRIKGEVIDVFRFSSLVVRECQFTECVGPYLIDFLGDGISPQLTILDCGFAGNQTDGGIFRTNLGLKLRNSSFLSNSSGYGPALGTLSYDAPEQSLAHLTITDNTVTNGATHSVKAGLFLSKGGSLHLTHSVFHNNTTSHDASPLSLVLAEDAGAFTLGPNWISGDPLLASPALLNPTRTFARRPLPGSPVIDVVSALPEVTRDQSGRARPENGLADFGAVEVYQDPYRAHLALQFDSALLADHEAKETLWGSFADGDRDGSTNAFELILDGDFLDPRHQPTTPMVFTNGAVTFNFFLREAMDNGTFTLGLEKGPSLDNLQPVDPMDWGGGNTVNGFTRFFHIAPQGERMFYRLTLNGLPQEHPILVGVGAPGNADAPGTGFGNVSEPFAIGRYEVTNAEFARFLNAVDPDGTNLFECYDPQMGSHTFGGLTLDSARPLGSRYAPKSGRERYPVNFVSYWAAIRYCNWLHNGATVGADTENGAYTLVGGMPVPINVASVPRQSGARFFLPNEDEWYKAAYFANDLSLGGLGLWANQPVNANTVVASAPPGGATSANLYPGGFVLSSFHPVGSYPDASSPWGAKDMAGNVREMIEQSNADEFPVLTPGGSTFDDVTISSRSQFASQSLPLFPFKGNVSTGFRIASRPN